MPSTEEAKSLVWEFTKTYQDTLEPGHGDRLHVKLRLPR